VSEEGKPLIMRKEFPEGAIEKPAVEGAIRAQSLPKLRCPHCLTDKPRRYSSYGGVNYYRCRLCVDPDTMRYTEFKVPRTDPLGPA